MTICRKPSIQSNHPFSFRVLFEADTSAEFYGMDVIRNWLNGSRDYQTGVQLYLEHGQHGLLKKLFTAEGFSDFKQQQLEKALSGLITPDQPKAPQGQKVATIAPVLSTQAIVSLIDASNNPDPERRRGWSNPMDATEQSLFDKWKPLFSEMLDLQACLENVARQGLKDQTFKEEAGRMALRIIDLDKQCDAIYSDRDYYLAHKKLPEAKSNLDISLDPAQWPLKLQNHQRYLREYKKKLEKETDADKRLKITQNIQQQEDYVAEYKKRLKLDA